MIKQGYLRLLNNLYNIYAIAVNVFDLRIIGFNGVFDLVAVFS